jgi:RNA polymerase sigma factor (sigma-70 family)
MQGQQTMRIDMNPATNDSLATRKSLLSRLRDLDDHESWRTFFDRYWRLFYNVARRSGLDESSAEDIVQETVISVARRIPGFQYDPERGSFKQWLLRITRRRIVDQLRRVYRQPPRAELAPEDLDDCADHATAVTDPVSAQIEKNWEEEWQRTIFDAAVARVRREINPKHFQVFDYCVLKGWPVSRVTATLGLNAAQVYLAKHRVALAVKRAARLIDSIEATEDSSPRHRR